MKRQSFAFQNISEIPRDVAEQTGKCVEELDLTNNRISDLRFLIEYPQLQTLVLDHNQITSHVKMPVMSNIHTLWVNHNKITNLSVFVAMLAKKCPNLRLLSMMNNAAAPSYFNSGTYQEYMDYRYFVISSLSKLEVLDDKKIEPNERSEAERIYRPREVKRKRKSSKTSQ